MSAPLAKQLGTATLRANTIFQAASYETKKLEGLIDRLQVLPDLISKCGPLIDSTQLSDLQSIDYISQSLAILTEILEDAASHTPDEWILEELQSIQKSKLAELKSEFTGGTLRAPDHNADGKCDFF